MMKTVYIILVKKYLLKEILPSLVILVLYSPPISVGPVALMMTRPAAAPEAVTNGPLLGDSIITVTG